MSSNKLKLCEKHPSIYQTFLCIQKGCNQLLCSNCIYQHCIDHQKLNTFPEVKSLEVLKEGLVASINEATKILRQEVDTIRLDSSSDILAHLNQTQEEIIKIITEFFNRKKEEALKELELMNQWNNSLHIKIQEFESLSVEVLNEEITSETLQKIAGRDFKYELEKIHLESSENAKLITLKKPEDIQEAITKALSEFIIFKQYNNHQTEVVSEKPKEGMNIEEIEESYNDEDQEALVFKNLWVQKLVQQLLFSPQKWHNDIEILQDKHTVIKRKTPDGGIAICLGGLLSQGIHSLTLRIDKLASSMYGNYWLAFGFINNNKHITVNYTHYRSAICICSKQTFHNVEIIEPAEVKTEVVYTFEANLLTGEVLIRGDNGLYCRGKVPQGKGLLPFFEFKGFHQITLLSHRWWEY